MGKLNSNEIHTEYKVLLAELASVAACNCTTALVLNTVCALYCTLATNTGSTNKHCLKDQLRVEMTVYYGLNCWMGQSSALCIPLLYAHMQGVVSTCP